MSSPNNAIKAQVAIIKAIREEGGMNPDKTLSYNSTQYDYLSGAKIIDGIGRKMAEHGLSFSLKTKTPPIFGGEPNLVHREQRNVGTKIADVEVVHRTWTNPFLYQEYVGVYTHADTGDFFEVEFPLWYPMPAPFDLKVNSTIITTVIKCAHRLAFQISGKDDTDPDLQSQEFTNKNSDYGVGEVITIPTNHLAAEAFKPARDSINSASAQIEEATIVIRDNPVKEQIRSLAARLKESRNIDNSTMLKECFPDKPNLTSQEVSNSPELTEQFKTYLENQLKPEPVVHLGAPTNGLPLTPQNVTQAALGDLIKNDNS